MTTTQERRAPVPDPPELDPAPVGLGLLGWARWTWRQLTSMRTALLLLMLLAVLAVPGSLFPQRNIDQVRVADYFEQHPDLAPWLDRLSLFDVYSSPWFSAVYLLLFISLVGCVLPRTRVHLANLRQPPPRTPARPVPAARAPQRRGGVEPRAGARRRARCAARAQVPHRRARRTRRALARRPARRAARDRQPALPPGARGRARRRRRRRPVGLPGAGHRAGGRLLREPDHQPRHVGPGRPRQR
ncbi:cytochrome c biogenesis protein ResB [Quadrisphaera sp. INWT6]|nr:cytochrome c biogenesis protein ResB [Quadrisphaera sp. INWT6]